MNLNALLNDTTKQSRRSFSVAEADRSLILVKRIVADLVEAHGHMLDLHESAEVAEEMGQAGRVDELYGDLKRKVCKLHGYLKELEEIGVELEEMSLGIVDFPSLADGKEVRLCWQLGQPTVRFWHEVGATAAMRRPIETLLRTRSSGARTPS